MSYFVGAYAASPNTTGWDPELEARYYERLRALPQVVLLDWNMPVMDGITFLRAARAEFGPDRPVVVLCTTEAALDSPWA